MAIYNYKYEPDNSDVKRITSKISIEYQEKLNQIVLEKTYNAIRVIQNLLKEGEDDEPKVVQQTLEIDLYDADFIHIF